MFGIEDMAGALAFVGREPAGLHHRQAPTTCRGTDGSPAQLMGTPAVHADSAASYGDGRSSITDDDGHGDGAARLQPARRYRHRL